MDVPIPEEALAQVRDAIFRGQRIEAIRVYRGCTGAGLAEAEAAVGRLEAELRVAEPDRFAGPAAGPDARPPIRLVAGVPLGCLLGAAPLVVFGAVLLVAGVRGGLSDRAFAARAVRAQGTVVRHDNRLPPGGATSNTQCRAVVSYQVGGETYEVHGPVQFRPGVHGWPQAYPVGEVVGVLYDPDRPGEAEVEGIGPAWAGGPLLFGGLGLTFLLLGIGLFWSQRRRWRARLSPQRPG
jgi:hypothetical protein